MSESYFTATPITGGESVQMNEADFKKAFIITSADLGGGHFRHMATVDRRMVNILQVPKSEIDELMSITADQATEPKPREAAAMPVAATSGRDRIAASLSGKAVKTAPPKLTGQSKIAASLTALAAGKASK